jgi:hypothetical protein
VSRPVRVAVVLGLGLLATACGGNVVTMTITQQQAAHEVQQRIHTTAAQLPSAARLEQQLTHFTPCDDPTDGGPPGRVAASTTYQIHDLPPGHYQQVFDSLLEWWQHNGFHVLDNDRRGQARFLWVENDRDGFRLTLQSNNVGGLFLIASSPCVWPNGKAPS